MKVAIGLSGWVPSSTPPYGPFLTGIPAAALLLFKAGAQIYAAIAMFKGRVSGWWVALVDEIATTAFLVLKVVRNPESSWTSLVIPVAYLIFVFWLRRHFPRKGSVGNGDTPPASGFTSPAPG